MNVKLDIGCGRAKKQGFIGIDTDSGSDADIIASALHIPIRDSAVDELACLHLVEHFCPDETRMFFGEILRVLKRGGHASLKIDRDWSTARLMRKDRTHKYRYDETEIADMVGDFAFAEVRGRIYRFGFRLRNKIFVELGK